MMINPTDDHVNILAIYKMSKIDQFEIHRQDFHENIALSNGWMAIPDENRRIDILPSLTYHFSFEEDEYMYSIITNQPPSMAGKKVDHTTKEVFEKFIELIQVQLSLFATDKQEKMSIEIFNKFGNHDWSYLIHESFLTLKVLNGKLMYLFVQKPYWKEEDE